MCTSNSDCTGGAKCVEGKCTSGVPPIDPPVPPTVVVEEEAKEEQDENIAQD